MSGDLAVPGLPDNSEWRDIVEQLSSELTDDVPDQVVRATELLLSGYTKGKAAKEVGVTVATLESWIRRYPTVAHVLADHRRYLHIWRMGQLEQQFLKAMQRSEEILNLDFHESTVNQKLVATVAQHARFVIGLFAAQQIDVNVRATATEPLLKARMDALQYIADQLKNRMDSGDPIPVSYIVTDGKDPRTKMPLNENGEPFFGTFGTLDVDEQGALCHICGSRQRLLGVHISKEHDMNVRDYETVFILPEGTVEHHDRTNE